MQHTEESSTAQRNRWNARHLTGEIGRTIEDMTFVGPDVAVVHVFRTNTGVTEKPIPSRNTLVLTRRDGKWGILAFHNTRLAEPDAK